MTVEPRIIFQDDSILVVDKPSGWIVNEAKSTKGQLVLQTWIKENFQFPISSFQSMRNGIVHRLDKETSGVLLVAKTEKAFRSLQRQFKERLVEKTYTALVHGDVEPKKGVINAPVGRLSWNRERFGVVPGGRNAITNYRSISNFEFPNKTKEFNESKVISTKRYTLLELKPKTGRTHQIRVHLRHIGYPIVGDEFYAGRKTARSDRKWSHRLFLHASAIRFSHPKLGKVVSYSSELPDGQKKVLRYLRKIK
jgi:23S rRNA pseudouridine1911/1915/1917 synthase